MSKFIKTIVVPGCKTELELLIPDIARRLGTVNLLCGENCSGKSFILQKLEAYYRSKPNMNGLKITFSNQSGEDVFNDTALFYGKLWKHKDRCASYHFSKQKNIAPSDGPANLYENVLRFFFETTLLKNNKFGISVDDFSNPENNEIRMELIKKLNIDFKMGTCHPCDSQHPLVQQVEKTIGNRRLYYRFFQEMKTDPAVEVVLVSPDNFITTQSRWSDGQTRRW